MISFGPCPNFPPCGHDAGAHRIEDVAIGPVCHGHDVISGPGCYQEVRCRCGHAEPPLIDGREYRRRQLARRRREAVSEDERAFLLRLLRIADHEGGRTGGRNLDHI
jgi:hypothetical protein